MVWRQFERYREFPLGSTSSFEVLYSKHRGSDLRLSTDFVHQSIGFRYPDYWTLTEKRRWQPLVNRQIMQHIYGPGENRSSSTNGEFSHILKRETYLSGQTVSEAWLEALGEGDEIKFTELLKHFREYLADVPYLSDVRPLDVIPDNLVIDQDQISSIDQEWYCSPHLMDVETSFVRGIVYFLARNATRLDTLSTPRRWGPRHGDFVNFSCAAVGADARSALEKLEVFEKRFRSVALKRFAVIAIQSMLDRRFGDQDSLELISVLSFCDDVVPEIHRIPFPVDSLRRGCVFQFGFSKIESQPDNLILCVPDWVSKPRIENLKISAKDRADSAPALDLRDPKQIARLLVEVPREECRRLLDGLHDSDDRVGFSLSLPPAIGEFSSERGWQVEINASWPELSFGSEAEEGLITHLWRKEGELQAAIEEADRLRGVVETVEGKLDNRTAELELLKSSKAWRVAEVLRKIFFGWRKPRDEVRNLSAIEQLSQKPAAPTERFSRLTEFQPDNDDSQVRTISAGPLISVVIPVHNTPKAWLADAVNSVRGQTYPHWHLILVNDGSTNVGTREFLDNLDDPRVTKIHLTRSAGISVATQMAVDGAHGEYVALMDHDDMLAPSALQKVAEKITDHNADVVYTDETTFSDRTEQKHNGYFGLPHLKPDYSPDLLLCHNYITHLLVIRKELIDQVGGFRPEFDGAQDFDLLLRVTEQTDRIIHISEPLYHWRQSVQSTSLDTGAKPLAHMRGCQAVTEALDRRGIEGEVLTGNGPHFFRVRRKIFDQPLVEIVIPFRDQPLMLRKCIEALLANTRYPQYRILGVDNGSTETLTHELMSQYESETDHVRFERLDVPFNFSQIVNFGVQNAQGIHVVLMNNDIEVINSDWLEAMLEHSQRPEVGAVGAKLYYPDDTIQHAGIAIGIGSYAGHPHKHVEGGYSGYLNRLHNIQNVSAVTGAMLMVKRELYNALGGFDEHLFKIACNDVDFCLRLRSQGLLNIFTPYARAYHHESVSRGYEDTPEKKARFEKEVDAFRKRHGEVLSQGDPYYNRHLRLDTEAVLARPWSEA